MDEHGLRGHPTTVPARQPRLAVLIGGDETGGAFALVVAVESRGAGTPLHLHNREDEALYVLEGCLKVWVTEGWVDVPVGAAVFFPRGAVHAYVVATETARVLVFVVPAGLEGFYREIGATEGRSGDVERLVATAARYGCEITGPTAEAVG
jgi:quercetin dioxygenase-like cupin family protein